MKIEDIELHAGKPDFAFTPVREIKAKCEASNALMPAPTEIEINAKLRSLAAKVGANAVVHVEYRSGISMTSWKSMTGTGLAVIKESDTVACPHCAEQIKRAAVKCRFCGEAVEPPRQQIANPSEIENMGLPPPLEETNNPIWWIIAVGGFILLMAIIGAASS